MDRRPLAAGLAALSLIAPAAAHASATQFSVMQDDDRLVYREEDSGRTIIPRVSFWELWNEPNQAGWLAPQWSHGVPQSPIMYRRLYYAGRRSLDATGHGGDVILIGNTAPLGSSARGERSPLRPK